MIHESTAKRGNTMTMHTHSYADMETHALAVAYDGMVKSLKELRAAIDAIEQELIGRIRDAGGTALPDDDFLIELKRGSPTYDVGMLQPLLESEVPTEELEKAYTPAHEEVVQVDAKWHGGQLNTLARRYGGEIADRIEQAKIPGPEKLDVKPREATNSRGGRGNA